MFYVLFSLSFVSLESSFLPDSTYFIVAYCNWGSLLSCGLLRVYFGKLELPFFAVLLT